MSFIEVQNQFMAYIRDPEHAAKPQGIKDERLGVYTELFFNNVDGFVSSAFPVLKSLYSDSQWHSLIRQFFVEHNCQSPYFLEISQEFLHFLQSQYQLTDDDPDFMLELAHYEWVELDVSVCMDDDTQSPVTDIAHDKLQLARTARNLSYQYPVHQISDSYVPSDVSEQPHYFVVYRDAEDEVAFIESNAMTALLVEQISQHDCIALNDLVKEVAAIVSQFTYEQLFQGAQQTLSALASLGVIVKQNNESP